MGHTKASPFDVVGDEEISNLNMAGAFCAGLAPVLLQQDRAFIVLKHHIIGDFEPLCFQEVSSPQDK